MKKHSGIIYVTLLAVIVVALIASEIPGIDFLGSWATPPVVLFLGLAFALVCGFPFPAFNKKMSKQLLQGSHLPASHRARISLSSRMVTICALTGL